MAKQLMIYDNIQPLSSEVHRNWAVQVDNYSFVSHLISAPVLATEIPFASAEFPIVFSATANEGEYIPLAIMGLKEGENLMLNDQNQFITRYIPAFIRRYPFVLGGDKSADTLALCIDEASTTIIKDGSKGRRLFEENGDQSSHLKEVVEFLKDYQYRAEMTKVFTRRLHELNLLEPMQANITFKGREDSNMNLMGFYVVKREKLKALSDADALDLFKKDGLELIYSHIQSLSNLNDLINKKSERLEASK
ncbi:multidrug transporter [Cellvibrio sp. KY-GH-1]|uniref:SapC family protein n=1 Tax=Cellvibrio sp. KY-GH-1 TaxID=2303332 RepID=UPI00124842D2|nr:SapC family protein [Cellvibrio sp. KY-GH-1]QEY14625.1 multidrug transporter [Cellvibrio sp. KY-GH-1]